MVEEKSEANTSINALKTTIIELKSKQTPMVILKEITSNFLSQSDSDDYEDDNKVGMTRNQAKKMFDHWYVL